MEKVDLKKLARVIDANFNRAKEGLRVCEDYCRFVIDHKNLTRDYKNIRHRLADTVESLGLLDFIVHRDIEGDVGKKSIVQEQTRKNFIDVYYANSQRVKESLRVLEEFAKLTDVAAAETLKKIRYKVYAVERRTVKVR